MLKCKNSFIFGGGATIKGAPIVNKRGFTLAEVLITLGIIGVVAAMTIPNLIANTRSHQYRSAFKKAVSTLSQAARMSQAQYGYDYAGINTTCVNPATDHPDEVMSACAIFNGTLSGLTYIGNVFDMDVRSGSTTKKYSISTSSQFFSSSTFNSYSYILADGTIVVLSTIFGRSSCTLQPGEVFNQEVIPTGSSLDGCWGFIDVNGVSLPNKEVSCSSGENKLAKNNCIVKNDAQHMTDIFPIRFHDGIVEPGTAAARYVLKTAK